jgi:hypothetical protein
MRPQYEVAQILREYGAGYREMHPVLMHHQRVLQAIERCRTAALGGHVERCDSCAHERIAYNSCRNRHCPKCQTTQRERWILARQADTLDCTYFHVVFTIPHELNPFCLKQPDVLYKILFRAAKESLFEMGQDPKHLGAQMGAIAILHTWGQNLSLHPHIHMIVPGGGFDAQGKWKTTQCKGNFLFPLKALQKLFRGKFMAYLREVLENLKIPLDASLRNTLYTKDWMVYAKQPFQNEAGVIEYLGRYSHKIAISNHRIKRIGDGQVTFTYKDYADASKTKLMTLDAHEFLRRFYLHILPPYFYKIRHYGFLSNRCKHKIRKQQMLEGKVRVKKEKLSPQEILLKKYGYDVEACPCCKTGKMKIVLHFAAHAPPEHFRKEAMQGKPNA